MADNPHPFSSVEDGRLLAQAIVDTIREPLLVLDKELRVVAASRAFYSSFQMGPHDVEGRPIYALGNGQWNIVELRILLERILPQHAVMEAYEVQQDFSGIGRRDMVLNARTVFFAQNERSLILLAIEDITARRSIERSLATLLSQKEMLLQEMQHRVANSLQIIASILLLKARTTSSEETRLHLRDAHRRVMSVASVQEHLQASAHGENFPIAPYLSRLCATLAASMIGEERSLRLEVSAGTGDVTSDEAVSIGLIVTELVINALKYAFGEGVVGDRIVVLYNKEEDNWRLTICDNGAGKIEGQATKASGLGTSIVEALARQLDSRVEVTVTVPQGMTVSIVHGAMPMRLPFAE
jgi:two-component sensor histidine kinase